MRVLILASLALLAGCNAEPERAPLLVSGITVSGHFGEEGEPSEDVSGLACDWQSGADAMRCLIIEDEGNAAQWVSFDGAIVRAGRRIGLFGVNAPLGTPPRAICSEEDASHRELDGEAAAFSDGIFYVTGSHGCSRNSDELRPAGFIVAQIAPDDPVGEVVPGTVAITLSHRLTGLLEGDPLLAGYYGAALRSENGLNVEGLAVQGERMVFGLRAPVVDGHAFLFETSVTALFSRDISGPGRAVPVALGADAGIRDLAFLPDGRLLILSGPAQDQDVPYRVQLRDTDGTVAALATVNTPRGTKAEAIAIVGMDGDAVSLLVLFDSADDGAPQSLTVTLPPNAGSSG